MQNERTALALTRTALSLLGTAMVVVKVMTPTAAVLAAALAAVSLLLTGWSLTAAARRYRQGHRRLVTAAALPAGQLPALVTVLWAAIGLAGLAFVVLHWADASPLGLSLRQPRPAPPTAVLRCSRSRV